MRHRVQGLEAVRESVIITSALLDEPGPRIEYVNAAFTDIFGYAPEEVIGKTPRLFQGPLTDREVLRRLRRDLERGDDFVGHTYNYRRSGEPFVLEWVVTPLRAAGVVTHYVACQRELSPAGAVALVGQAQRLRALVEADDAWRTEADAVVRARLDGLVRAANLTPREEEVLRLMVLGRNLAEIAIVLGVARRTAKFHRANVLDKLGVTSELELVRLVLA